jgi:ppGpp synthetase/RelA/SpoT-type nucleotidyltranferase
LKLAWTELKFSKKEVRRAGDYLIENYQNITEIHKFMESLDVLSNWRASHAYPMQSMLNYFRIKSFNIDKDSIIVQRLKRTPSILAKLTRENGMKLDRIEDIAGCRIIVSNKSNVGLVRDSIVKGGTRNNLHRERDYIQNPKSSGYRGIHLVYKYNCRKSQFKGHSVELQIRSKVQHSWATAVEVVGTFTGQALKASQGGESWLSFFKLVSKAFADIENRKLSKNANTSERLELIDAIEALNVLPRLRAFAVSTQLVGKDKKNQRDYFLLVLKIDESRIQVNRFSGDQLDKATSAYTELEKSFENNDKRDVVLVSASSIHGLKKAYPNYFADTTEFSRNLEKIIATNKKLQHNRKYN